MFVQHLLIVGISASAFFFVLLVPVAWSPGFQGSGTTTSSDPIEDTVPRTLKEDDSGVPDEASNAYRHIGLPLARRKNCMDVGTK